MGLRRLDNNNSVGLSGFVFLLVVKLLGLGMGMATTTMSFDGVCKFLYPLRSFLMPAAIKKEVEEVPVLYKGITTVINTRILVKASTKVEALLIGQVSENKQCVKNVLNVFKFTF